MPPSGKSIQALFVQVPNFSKIYAAIPMGESLMAMPVNKEKKLSFIS